MSDRHPCLGAHAVEKAEKTCGCCTSSTGTSWVPPIRSTSAPLGAGRSAPPPLSVMGATSSCELGQASYVRPRSPSANSQQDRVRGRGVSGARPRAAGQFSRIFNV